MKKSKLLISAVLILILAGVIFIILKGGQKFEVGSLSQSQEETAEQKYGGKSAISGLGCENWQRRPVAVMLAGDAVARPLSGLFEADLVFNMPVFEDMITRMMAVYVCGEPKEIGSVRSARHDFIPLAAGLDAIYAHWGGSHFALDKLKKGVIDNLDALPNLYNAFYRKSGIRAPHNGFTSMKRLLKAAKKIGYRLENKFVGYQHLNESVVQDKQAGRLILPNVEYQYDPEKNTYLRWRAGRKEIDRNTWEQVGAKNVVIMRAQARQIEGQYNDVDIEGSGQCQVYQNGQVIDCTWRKDRSSLSSKLIFLDSGGQEIKFTPGQIWIEILQPNQEVKWSL